MKTAATFATLALLAAPAIASDQSNRPPTNQTTTGGGLNPNMIQTPFRFVASGNYVFVINGGTADWTAPLDVTITCAPVAPTKSCAKSPVTKHYAKGEFPPGHGQAPASAPSGNSVIITQGGGYDAIFMGEAVGTYQFVAKAANNASNPMSVNVTTPPPGSPTPVVVRPATVAIAPK